MIYATHGRNQDQDAAVLDVRKHSMCASDSVIAIVCSLVLALAMCLAMVLIPVPVAMADDAADAGSITVNYEDGDTPIADATAHVYHIANWNNSNDGFTPTDQFKKYSVDWDVYGMNSETFRQLAETLSGYIARDTIDPLVSQKTDTDGVAVFGKLPRGLYVVIVDAFEGNGLTCKSSATIVSVPSGTAANASLNVSLHPKTECSPKETPPPDVPPTEDRTVSKVWKNDTVENRPRKIIVQLLRNGEVYDEVELNDDNNWTHTWTGLEADYEWHVVEKSVPDSYTVLVDREGAKTVITNTYTPPDTPPTNPPTDNPPTDNPPPDTPPSFSKTGANVTTLSASAVGIAGLGLILLAVRRRLRNADQQDQQGESDRC